VADEEIEVGSQDGGVYFFRVMLTRLNR